MNEQPTTPAARLVVFLHQVAMLRSKMIRDVGAYEKTLWFSNIPEVDGCRTPAWKDDRTQGAEEWLVVGRREKSEPSLPPIPESCENWIEQKALRDKTTSPTLLESRTTDIPNPDWGKGSGQPKTIPHFERLADHPELEADWEQYIAEEWEPWRDAHNIWEKADQAYSDLFAIHKELQRSAEEYELVLGLGLLTWLAPSDSQKVRRHLLVANAMLEFDAKAGRFTVRPHPEGARLRPELDMLNPADQPGHAEEAARETLTEGDDDPWQQDCVEGVLKALVHSIDPQGRYSDAPAAE